MTTEWKTTARSLEREIKSVTELVQREGKTDVIEDRLDQLEHRIGAFGQVEECKAYAKRLKDQLDEVK